MNNIARLMYEIKTSERDDLAIQVEALDALRDQFGKVAETLNNYNAAATVSEALQALYQKIDETIIDVTTYQDFITEDLANVTKTLDELQRSDW